MQYNKISYLYLLTYKQKLEYTAKSDKFNDTEKLFRLRIRIQLMNVCLYALVDVELVHGYNVYMTPCQLHEVIACSGGLPTKLIRALLTVYFDNNTLASSSALGSRGHPSSDTNIRGEHDKKTTTRSLESTKETTKINILLIIPVFMYIIYLSVNIYC